MHRARLRPTLALVVLLTLVTFPALPVRADATYTSPSNTVRFQVPDAWKMGATPDAADDVQVIQPTAWTTTNPAGTFSLSATATYLLSTFAAADSNGLVTASYLDAGQAVVANAIADTSDLHREPGACRSQEPPVSVSRVLSNYTRSMACPPYAASSDRNARSSSPNTRGPMKLSSNAPTVRPRTWSGVAAHAPWPSCR